MAENALLHDGLRVLQAALDAVSPARLIAEVDLESLLDRPLKSYSRVRVVGAGKAAMAMAGALEKRYPPYEWQGAVTVPHGYPDTFPSHESGPRKIAVRTASHPVPDAASAAAAVEALRMARDLGGSDLLIVLLSGGASALWTLPIGFAETRDMATVATLLLESGADIHEVNAVRKHLSRIAGGRLAAAAAPATILTLAISDVPGDDPASIGSGPTAADPSTFRDALDVLDRYGITARMPRSALNLLKAGSQGDMPETLKPGHAALERAHFHVLATNTTAVRAAAEYAAALGYPVEVATLSGEAREAGKHVAATLERDDRDRVCHLFGGETTVVVRGNGRGGRNQELALSAALALEAIPFESLVLSVGTDGIDGPTDAAGAWADENTAARARAAGADPEDHLRRNDSYALFDTLDQSIRTGPTHTNVMDVVVALARR